MVPTSKAKLAVKTIWCVYNHVPGGQLVAQHFDTYSRKRKTSESTTEEVEFTAQTQLDNFQKSDFVALKMKGKDLEKNKVLVFPENISLPRDPANTVLQWAIAQGAEPLPMPTQAKKEATMSSPDPEQQEQIDSLKKSVEKLEKGQAETQTGIAAILQKLNAKDGE
jgi:hypothetical protein